MGGDSRVRLWAVTSTDGASALEPRTDSVEADLDSLPAKTEDLLAAVFAATFVDAAQRLGDPAPMLDPGDVVFGVAGEAGSVSLVVRALGSSNEIEWDGTVADAIHAVTDVALQAASSWVEGY